jgi:hypothetical protein
MKSKFSTKSFHQQLRLTAMETKRFGLQLPLAFAKGERIFSCCGFVSATPLRWLLLLAFCGVFLPQNSTAQIKQFFHSPGPVRAWVVTHPFIAQKCLRISQRALALADSMRTSPTLDGDWNGGQVDAFRHGIWMCLLVQKITPKKAQKLGKAYEKGNYRMYKRGKLEDGSQQDLASSIMDANNNGIGVALGMTHRGKSEAELVRIIVKAIQADEFWTILKDSAGNSIELSGTVIPNSEWQGKWENDRCLKRPGAANLPFIRKE